MEQLEKVEKLRERANVTYEEAKEALEACGWDLLDAMVYLEKAGKAKAPSQESYSTSYEEQTQYVSVKDKVQEQKQKNTENGFGKKMGRLFKKISQKCRDNSFRIERKGEEILKVPLWALVLAALISWRTVLVVLVVGLFLKCRYSFGGKDDMKEVNHVMEKAGEFADKIKDEYDKL